MEGKIVMTADEVYRIIISTLDSREWRYDAEEDEKTIRLGVNGDSLPINIVLRVDEERKLIRLYSPLPFKMSEDKRMEGAIAACAASYGMVNGNFNYDITEGIILFRMTNCYENCAVGQGLIRYMIDFACATVDEYSAHFFALNKGIIGVDKFVEMVLGQMDDSSDTDSEE